MKRIALSLLIITSSLFGEEGVFINPLTDVCWECVFPITVSGVNVTPGNSDHVNYTKRFCVCGGVPPKVGIPLTFWEPTKMVDVTRHPYKLIGLGGISIGKESVKNRGTVGTVSEDTLTSSFYHVHMYSYPIFHILEMFTDFVCIDKGELDVAYMSEFDPLWNDDQLALILNPEAALF